MKKSVILVALAGVTVFMGCDRSQHPVQTAANCPECMTCGDNETERNRLAADGEAYRQLAARRQVIYDQLRRDLAALIEGGQVRLVFRRGMIVMQLPNQILYRSGRAELTDGGSQAVTTIGEAIASIDDRRFLVAGHTDNQPIQASTWHSNWHLSSERAQVVLDVLLEAGVIPSQLAAAGFGEHDPVDSNDAPDGQSQNRRTEIMVVPNLEQIFRSVQTAPATK